MSVAESLELERIATADLGRSLVDLSSRLAAMECEWLATLAEFDRRYGWWNDGEISCVDWLVCRCGLSRVTAREKLRVAHELERRQMVRAAFAVGALSYSKVRAITRVVGADEETDRFLLKLADAGTTADLEQAARHWMQLQDQEKPVDDYLRRWDRSTVRSAHTYDGMMVIETVVPVEEGEEALAHMRAAETVGPVDSAESTGVRRVRAFLDLLRAGHANLDTPSDTSGADRYTLHAVADIEVLTAAGSGRAELIDGTPVVPETIQRWSCDCGIIRHVVKGGSEPIDIGRRTSVWTAAQRRAVSVRDHGRCRWPNCWRRTCDIHHVIWYENGGVTAVSNGCLLCPHHHTYVHEPGFPISGEANGELIFRRPDGGLVGASAAGGPAAAN
jgi:hypothetical protein